MKGPQRELASPQPCTLGVPGHLSKGGLIYRGERKWGGSSHTQCAHPRLGLLSCQRPSPRLLKWQGEVSLQPNINICTVFAPLT
jgi:hypothetical protein